MKCLLINLIVCVTVVKLDIKKPLFLPQLPVGEYRINFLGVMRCNTVQTNNKITYQLYLSKSSVNTTEIKGNITHLVPLDDTLNLEFDFAIKDSIGGWKENAYFYKTPKACSSLKMFFGKAWTPIMDGLGIYNATCPIPVGFFKGPGIDNTVFHSSNFPKSFFYGTYKFRSYLTKKNEIYGCFTAIMELKRPWETI